MFRKSLLGAVVGGVMLVNATMFVPVGAQIVTDIQCTKSYTVVRGDTLAKIARSVGRSVSQLKDWNFLTNANQITVGQVLCVDTIEANMGTTYTVQRGDTLGKIARRFGISWRVLADVNKIKNANLIYVGQVLTIPEVTIQ
jgi:LysM repeat protein